MAECPYCSGPVDDGDRFCPRCGERQTDCGDREGVFDPAVVQYLDGVRNGARTFETDSPHHDRFETQLRAAVEDFATLAGTGVDLRAVLNVETLPDLTDPVDPGADTDAATRQVVGLAVLFGLATAGFDSVEGDELLAYDHLLRESL